MSQEDGPITTVLSVGSTVHEQNTQTYSMIEDGSYFNQQRINLKIDKYNI